MGTGAEPQVLLVDKTENSNRSDQLMLNSQQISCSKLDGSQSDMMSQYEGSMNNVPLEENFLTQNPGKTTYNNMNKSRLISTHKTLQIVTQQDNNYGMKATTGRMLDGHTQHNSQRFSVMTSDRNNAGMHIT